MNAVTVASTVIEVGEAFLTAITTRDFAAARELLAQDVEFRMLVPSGVMTEGDADSTIGRFSGWFGTADRLETASQTANEVEGRVALAYRFTLKRQDGWRVIQQHLMLDVVDSRISRIDLLCSGFRPLADPAVGVHEFDAGELGCGDGLAGEFRRRMQEIPLGDVLVVTTRDPAAKEDLPPLARMLGHVVRSTETAENGSLLVTVERGR
jgi:TusA-related sulfurtransferase